MLCLLLLLGTATFSHQRHAPLKLTCTYCHPNATKAERAGMPAVQRCQACHPAMKPAGPFAARDHAIADFVIFSHARHAAAKLACATCHGEVWNTDRPKPHIPLTMKACMDCHKAHRASVTCAVCHELGQ